MSDQCVREPKSQNLSPPPTGVSGPPALGNRSSFRTGVLLKGAPSDSLFYKFLLVSMRIIFCRINKPVRTTVLSETLTQGL
jgi:hypothetical protein